eukprot:1177398-Prorocentrum_minimum.AAC.6
MSPFADVARGEHAGGFPRSADGFPTLVLSYVFVSPYLRTTRRSYALKQYRTARLRTRLEPTKLTCGRRTVGCAAMRWVSASALVEGSALERAFFPGSTGGFSAPGGGGSLSFTYSTWATCRPMVGAPQISGAGATETAGRVLYANLKS